MALAEDVASPDIGILVAEVDGRVAGVFEVAPVELSSTHSGPARPAGQCLLSFGATLPEVRGSGVGRALTAACMAWAHAAGYASHGHGLAGHQPAGVTLLAGPVRSHVPAALPVGAVTRWIVTSIGGTAVLPGTTIDASSPTTAGSPASPGATATARPAPGTASGLAIGPAVATRMYCGSPGGHHGAGGRLPGRARAGGGRSVRRGTR